jgi:hypothetical protein
MPLIKFRSSYTEHRAIYSYTVHGDIIAIVDHDQGKTVTLCKYIHKVNYGQI